MENKMAENKNSNTGFLAICILIGLLGLGYFISDGIVSFKQMDRVVTVKGLAEREVEADVAIWPIAFNETSNELTSLYSSIENKSKKVISFLKDNGFEDSEITVSNPAIQDNQANAYIDPAKVKFRYATRVTVTVYTPKVDLVLSAMKKVSELMKSGIAVAGEDYNSRTQFIFNGLNDIKPAMIAEATKNARESALQFAKDSDSELGKIRTASQGQFSIYDRDSNTPQIKKVRVVSTVQYYLSD